MKLRMIAIIELFVAVQVFERRECRFFSNDFSRRSMEEV